MININIDLHSIIGNYINPIYEHRINKFLEYNYYIQFFNHYELIIYYTEHYKTCSYLFKYIFKNFQFTKKYIIIFLR